MPCFGNTVKSLFISSLFLALLGFAESCFAKSSKADSAFKATAEEVLSVVSMKAFDETHKYALDILEVCPPEKCVLLSLGMTNTLLDSFFRYYIEKHQLSESYLKYAPFKGLLSLDGRRIEDLDRFLRKILPTDKELGGKKLMILRNLDAGWTLSDAFFPQLKNFIKRNQLSWKVGGFLTTTRPDFQLTQDMLSERWPNWEFHFQDISDQNNEISKSYRAIDYAYYRYKIIQLYPGQRLVSTYEDGGKYLGLDRLTSLFIEDRAAFKKLTPKTLRKWRTGNCQDWLIDYK